MEPKRIGKRVRTPARGSDFRFHLNTSRLRAAQGLAGEASAAGAPAVAVTVLDNFDQALRRSDRILLDAGSQVHLLGPDGVLSQPAAKGVRFVGDLAEGVVKRALADLSPLRALLPVGHAMLYHKVVELVGTAKHPGGRADLMTLTVGTKAKVILQATGAPAGVKAVSCKAAGLPVASLYRLFPAAGAHRKRKPQFDRDTSAFDVAFDLIAALLPVVRSFERGIIHDIDTEFLHDYRVALRKVRSVPGLFKGVFSPQVTADLKSRFAAVMAPTGALRDLDVYLLQRQSHLAALPPALREGLETQFALLTQRRVAAQAALASHLQSAAYQADMAGLERLFARRKRLDPGPKAGLAAYGFACGLIWARYGKIGQMAAGIGPQSADAEIHALRIACKKLRYLMEFFAPIFPGPRLDALLGPLKALQDNLGLIHDTAVQEASLQVFVAADCAGKPDMAQSVAALIVQLHQGQMAERAKTVKRLAQFNAAANRRRFRALFKPAARPK